jgi:hypothetical protein
MQRSIEQFSGRIDVRPRLNQGRNLLHVPAH